MQQAVPELFWANIAMKLVDPDWNTKSVNHPVNVHVLARILFLRAAGSMYAVPIERESRRG